MSAQNARLADARLARDERDLTFAVARLARAVEEQRQFMRAPYEARQMFRPRRLEAADVLRLPKDRPAENRRVEAFRVRGPSGSNSNAPPRSRRVDSAITTVPGSASACNRAARLGVSPTTACSCAGRCQTRSPTTTIPVACQRGS
jgi:hypothetical protein